MYDDKIYLNPEEILNHDFKIDARGYRPQEVDKYLDMVIRDYTEFNNIIKDLNNQIGNLTNDNHALKAEIRRLQMELDSERNQNNSREKTYTNIDLLKRISNLEKIVYGKSEFYNSDNNDNE